MAKRGKAEGAECGEELIAGVPLRCVQEFLCLEAQYSERKEPNEHWFDRFGVWGTFTEHKADVERLARELRARGWIEKVTSRAAARRYRLTEAGRRYAAESRHLFKWPAAQSRIRPAPRYGIGRKWFDCLKHLHLELSRVRMGAGYPENNMAPHQRKLLRDLKGGLDEEAISFMFDYWNYNKDSIAKRSKLLWGRHRLTPAKPRIDLSVYMSGKGNLIAEWNPTGVELFGIGRAVQFDTKDSDWSRWEIMQHRDVAFTSRPSNELMFIHNVFDARRYFPGIYSPKWPSPPDQLMIDAILLQAAAALWEELKERLERNFEVRIINDIFVEWEEVSSKHWGDHPHSVLASWIIENVERRNNRLEQEEIARFSDVYGCPLEVFVKALIDADAKKATGPAPAPHTKYDRVSRQLKKAGHSKITIGVVVRYHALLQKHSPELFPPAPAAQTERTMTAIPTRENIVPFIKPNGSDGPSNGGPPTAKS